MQKRFGVGSEARREPTIIRLEGVTVRRGERVLLRDVSWRVRLGEHWAVLGLNGSGKTSLLRLVSGYLWPTEGTVQVLGMTFGKTDLRDLRSRIGLVSTYLKEWLERDYPEETVLNVVTSGFGAFIGRGKTKNPEIEEPATEILTRLGGGNLERRPFAKLSQGQKQIVLIARALAPRPDLLLLDEPCAGLDLAAREALLSSLERVTGEGEKPVVIYVTHHPEEILPFFSHTLLLRDGEAVAQGEKTQALTSQNLTSAFGLPLEITWKEERAWATVGRRSE